MAQPIGAGSLYGAQAPLPGQGPIPAALDDEKIIGLIQELASPDRRENALNLLSKQREAVPNMAPLLWHSFGTMTILLQEIMAIYPLLSPPNLSATASNRRAGGRRSCASWSTPPVKRRAGGSRRCSSVAARPR